MAKRYPEKEPSPHIEEQIYEGFASGADQAIMAQFQVTEWDRRAELANKLHDQRMKQLAYRLIYLERPDLLSESRRHSFDDRVAERLLCGER